MPAKQSEGIREGVQDHEYLSMLKDRVAELKKAGRKSKDIDDAEIIARAMAYEPSYFVVG